MNSDRCTGRDVDGGVCGLVTALFPHMPWTTEDHTRRVSEDQRWAARRALGPAL
jgi:hypothetical protein